VRLSSSLAAGNSAGNFRKRIHKDMNLLELFLELDALTGTIKNNSLALILILFLEVFAAPPKGRVR
jgi:hypothetical protein